MIAHISITVGDIITKIFLLKTNVLKFTQHFERKIQRNKRFIKLFTNVQYASPWLHVTHQNDISFLAKLEQAYRNRWLSRPQLSESHLSEIYVEHMSTSCFYQIPKHKTLSPV